MADFERLIFRVGISGVEMGKRRHMFDFVQTCLFIKLVCDYFPNLGRRVLTVCSSSPAFCCIKATSDPHEISRADMKFSKLSKNIKL